MLSSLSLANDRSFLKLFLGLIVVIVIINEPRFTGAAGFSPGESESFNPGERPSLLRLAYSTNRCVRSLSFSFLRFLYTSPRMSSRSSQAARSRDCKILLRLSIETAKLKAYYVRLGIRKIRGLIEPDSYGRPRTLGVFPSV